MTRIDARKRRVVIGADDPSVTARAGLVLVAEVDPIRVGKFNAGQKLNASLACGSILVLLGSGLLMYFIGLSPLPWRTGATFVHDWFALGLGLLIVGHLAFALKDPEARRGMRTGRVSRAWVRAEHAAWLDDIDAHGNGAPGERSLGTAVGAGGWHVPDVGPPGNHDVTGGSGPVH